MATVMHGAILLSTIFLICDGVEATASNDKTVGSDGNNTTASYKNYNTSGADWNSTTDIDNITGFVFTYYSRPSYEPSTGVVVGEVATLKCDFRYEIWNRYKVNETMKFSLFLSRVQIIRTWSDPDSEWPETNYAWSESIQLKPGYNYGNYTKIHNRIIQRNDSGTYLICRIISESSAIDWKPLRFGIHVDDLANGSIIPKSSSVLLFLYFGLMLLIVV